MDKDLMHKALPALIANMQRRQENYTEVTIVAGAAPGADTLAAEWARENGVPVEEHPAKWDEHGRAAGAIRNIEMLNSGCDGVIAFPGGPGTKHMMTIAQTIGVPVIQVHIGSLYADSTIDQLQGSSEETSAGVELSGLSEVSESSESDSGGVGSGD